MEFPKVCNRNKWKILKDNENHWLEFDDRDRKLVGLRTVYERIGSNGDEKVLELNLFKRGAVVQMWFRGLIKNSARIQSRMMKYGQWVYGAPNEKVVLIEQIAPGDRFVGIKINLKLSSGYIDTSYVYKRGFNPSLFPKHIDKTFDELT